MRAFSQLYAKNKCCETVSISVGYWDYSSSRWVASGWWEVLPCTQVLDFVDNQAKDGWECKTKVLISEPLNTNHNYYYYAYSSSYEWKGTTSFCTSDKNYVYYDVSNCIKRNSFRMVDNGTNTYSTITLTCPCKSNININSVNMPDLLRDR